MEYLSLIDFCEDCQTHIVNAYGPLKLEGDLWYITRKTPSGRYERIKFFGLSEVFRIKVCPHCGSRKLTNYEHGTFPSFERLTIGLKQARDVLESEGHIVFIADYSEPEP